jgi:hypothetical protein
MTGVHFVTDERGRKTAVLIDLKKHRQVWEDFYDALLAEQRRGEEEEPYDEYRARRLGNTLPSG